MPLFRGAAPPIGSPEVVAAIVERRDKGAAAAESEFAATSA